MRRANKVDIARVHEILRDEFVKYHMPVVELIQMQTKDPFKVLVTTILSARTRDQTTVKAAKCLFGRVQKAPDLKQLTVRQIEKLIFPVGFYRNKARFLHALPGELEKQFDGNIPATVDELVRLPGVGRKTANLVVAVAFDKPAVCVDIHVHRICNRLGYVHTATPYETEMRLRTILPVMYWTSFNSYMVSFGQHTCLPVNPRCNVCPVLRYCSRTNVSTRFTP